MPLTFVNDAVKDGGAANDTTFDTNTMDVTAGNLLCAFVKHEGAATTIAVADTGATNAMTGLTKKTHGNGDQHGQWFWLAAADSAGTKTFRVTLGAARQFVSIIVFQHSYTGTATLDAQNGSTGTSTSPVTGNISTTGTDELVVVGYAEYSAQFPTSELTNGASPAAVKDVGDGSGNFTSAWRSVLSATFSNGQGACTITSADWVLAIAAFKVTGAATSALEWRAPAVQLTNHQVTAIINMQALSPMPVPYLRTTATRVTNPLDWVTVHPDVIWTDG